MKDNWNAGEGTRATTRAPNARASKSCGPKESNAFGSLISLLFEPDELARWRAIAELGEAAAATAERNPGPVRNLVRRLFYSLNEDSGMAGWHSPEAIGEILVRVPELIDEYGSHLGAYLQRPPFERGAHWAVARVAAVRPEAVSDCAGDLLLSLRATDPYLRGYAATALAAMRWTAARGRLEELQDDPGRLTQYHFASGELAETTVGQLAQAALLTLDRA